MQEHENEIENIINDALKEIRKCIISNKEHILRLEKTVITPIHEDLFIEDLKNKLNSCAEEENKEMCLRNIQDYAEEEFLNAEVTVLQSVSFHFIYIPIMNGFLI